MRIVKLLLVYGGSLLLGTLLYLATFWAEVMGRYDFLFVRSGGALLVVACLVFVVLYFLKANKLWFGEFIITQDVFLISLLLVFLNWFVYGLIPFNVSRSNSVLILGYLYESAGEKRTKADIIDYANEEYLYRYDAVKIRLDEQIMSGNVEQIDGGYFITWKGRCVAEVFHRVAGYYNLKNDFLSAPINSSSMHACL